MRLPLPNLDNLKKMKCVQHIVVDVCLVHLLLLSFSLRSLPFEFDPLDLVLVDMFSGFLFGVVQMLQCPQAEIVISPSSEQNFFENVSYTSCFSASAAVNLEQA